MSLGLQAFRSALRANEIYNMTNAKTTEELDSEVRRYEQIRQERSRMGLVKRVIDFFDEIGSTMPFEEYLVAKRILSQRQPT